MFIDEIDAHSWYHKNNSSRGEDMDQDKYQEYIDILKEELVCAMGCTEPIAVAYAAALARKVLGRIPERVRVKASSNIIKNVKSVVVPNTGGARGISAAAAAGIIAGDADQELRVLAFISPEEITQMKDFLEHTEILVTPSDKEYIFHIEVSLEAEGHHSKVEIAGFHTNVIHVEVDGKTLQAHDYEEQSNHYKTDRSLLSIEDIITFADQVDLALLEELLQRQIDCNMAIAREALGGDYGANIGKILLESYGDDVFNKAKAYAAAGSDGRMNGCELPVVINSGSGNQGLTASLPVVIYAEELGSSQEELYRALVVSNLVTIHLKTGIGRLSAYCGATSAGCGAAAGISYLHGGRYEDVAHTIVNAVAINSGMICDGAKASCAAKIASAVEAGLLGYQMQRSGQQFYDGDGIVVKGVENTIRNVGALASIGMRETDKTIIELMTRGSC